MLCYLHSLCTEGCVRTVRSTCMGVRKCICMDHSYSTFPTSLDTFLLSLNSTDLTTLCVIYTYVMCIHRSVNPYDVREVCEQPPLCYTFVDPITKFMNQEDVRSDLGEREGECWE